MLWRKLKVTEVEWENDKGGIIWEGFWMDGLYAEIWIFRRKPKSKYLKKRSIWVRVSHPSHGFNQLQMQNLCIWRAHCTRPFYIRDLHICEFWYGGRGWNRSPTDIKGQLYCKQRHSKCKDSKEEWLRAKCFLSATKAWDRGDNTKKRC